MYVIRQRDREVWEGGREGRRDRGKEKREREGVNVVLFTSCMRGSCGCCCQATCV